MHDLLKGNRESLTAKASYLRIAARAISESMRSGGFRSLYKGQGIEFSGVREYLRGDDVRSIDWNVTARMSKAFVKVFEEEHELQMFLIVDRSASMFTGSNGNFKYGTCAESAALLTLACELNDSPVGAVFFDGQIHFSCLPESGRQQTMHLLSKLDEVESIQRGSVLGSAIKGAVKMLKKRSLVFIISDFRSDKWQESFDLLCSKHKVVALRIMDMSDVELPKMGAVPFTDLETGARLLFPTSHASFRSKWKEGYRKKTAHLEDFCFRHGADFVSISTQEDVVRVLSRYFISKSGGLN